MRLPVCFTRISSQGTLGPSTPTRSMLRPAGWDKKWYWCKLGVHRDDVITAHLSMLALYLLQLLECYIFTTKTNRLKQGKKERKKERKREREIFPPIYVIKEWKRKKMHLLMSRLYTPALLQSTQKLFFWPMKPLVRPGPLATTLLASELMGAPCWEQLMARVTGSTMTEEVSCILWLDTSLVPGRRRKQCKLMMLAFPLIFYI